MKKNLLKILTLSLVATLIVVSVCCICPNGVAYAEFFGGKNANDLWYYGASYLNVDGLKTEIAKWDLSKAESPVVIAVMDTGVNYSHELFEGVMLKDGTGNVLCYNSYYAYKNEHPTTAQLVNVVDTTSNYHGTSVAGIMAMLIRELGLSDYIKLYPIKASNCGKSENALGFAYGSVKTAINYLLGDTAPVVDVVNMSFTGTDDEWASKEMASLIASLSQKAVVVAAAGNDNADSANKKGYPAAHSGAVSVMAYQAGGTKHNTSNYGSIYDLIAPGKDIYTAKGSASDYQNISGTSMAAAFVSVTAALIKLRDVAAGNESYYSPLRAAKHLRTSAKGTIRYIDDDGKIFDFKKLSMLDTLTSNYDNAYVEPYALEVSDKNALFDNGTLKMKTHDVKNIILNATFLPVDAVNPLLYNEIEWYLVKLGERNKVDGEGNELDEKEIYEQSSALIAKGANLDYTPDISDKNAVGNFIIRAQFTSENNSFKVDNKYTLEYAEYGYFESEMAVVLDRDRTVSSASTFTKKKLTFTLPYLEYLNPDVEVKWFVNGEYVSSGQKFVFSSKEKGDFVISAQYGDEIVIGKTFSVNVRPSVESTGSIIAISFSCAFLVAGVIIAVVLAVKKRKAKTDENIEK